MTIYDELKRAQYLPDAFIQWKEYRNALTQYLIETIQKGSSIVILGAGMCNDIDVEKLVNQGMCLTLIDRDINLLKQMKENYPNIDMTKVTLLEIDFAGITDEEYRTFCDHLIRLVKVDRKQTNIIEVAEFVKIYLTDLYQQAAQRKIFDKNLAFDYCIAFGLYSQLNNMFPWIWEIVLSNLQKKEERVFKFLKQKTSQIIEKLNDELCTIVKKELILGIEVQRIGVESKIEGSIQALMDIEKE